MPIARRLCRKAIDARRASRTLVELLVLCGLAPCAWAAGAFNDCATRVAAQPAVYESYRCYYEAAGSNGEWRTADRELARLAATHPDIDWIVFVRGLVTWPSDKAAAERLYLEAARRFQRADNVRGEVLARANLQILFFESGRVASAAREVERVSALALQAEDPEVRVRARVVEAQYFISAGTHLGRAYRALKRAEADLEATPTYWLRHHVFHGLGKVLLLMGRYDEAVGYFHRLREAASAQHDQVAMARAQIDAANALLEKRSQEPDAVDATQLFADAEAALAAARQARDLDLQLHALRLSGEVLMVDHAGRALGFIEACVEQAKRHARSKELSECLWIQGRLLAETDPVAAQRAVDAAIELLQHQEGTDYALLAYAWRNAMRTAWQTQSTEAAILTGKKALTAIERLRDLQPGWQSRAAALSAWTQDYYWLSGRILQVARSPALLNEGFQVGERMRARSLLDQVSAPPRASVDLDEATLRRRDALLKAIVDVNRRLLQSQDNESAELLRTLEALEREEVDVREMQDAPRVAANPVSLATVQASLAPDEALLSFQVGLGKGATDRFAGGAWVFAITREQARIFAIPDRAALSQSLALFKGLMNQAPPYRRQAGLTLYKQLLRDALTSLPNDIQRLIIVPDSPLDTFPLWALGVAPSFEPLARRYEIVVVPSATIWHHWRARSEPARNRPALVLADPQLEFATGEASRFRTWSLQSGLSLGGLPHAREEGLEIIERLGGQGTLWTAAAASEAALKASRLADFGVLHFATHTIVDSSNADRSAILLASGARREDGLLQSREIADLRLDGAVVVLSSCQSATGTRMRGEGVLSLARAFFTSGARVVIGSLWPIRDDHAEAFFKAFYAALADGRTAGAAFHHAQNQLIAQGLPLQAWAGFVLMGDPDVTPVNAVARPVVNWSFVVAVLVLLGAIILGAWLRRYFRVTT